MYTYTLRKRQRAWFYKHDPGAVVDVMFGISHDDATEYLTDGLDVESIRRLAHQQQILIQPDGLHELAREAFINGVINELERLCPRPSQGFAKPRTRNYGGTQWRVSSNGRTRSQIMRDLWAQGKIVRKKRNLVDLIYGKTIIKEN